MWGRIYPLVVFLISANFIFKASCKEKGSLTFLIDDTGSMSDDIRQVRNSVNRIMNTVFNEKSSLISNMVLVTFNDPDAQVRVVTKNRRIFKTKLDAVYAHNVDNRDCWEPSMNGLLLALDKSNHDSFIYVFTDAPARDYRDAHLVMDKCQKKQTQIVFVITGHCRDKYGAKPFDVYFDIANACSGLAFDVPKGDVKAALDSIDETIKGNKTVLTTAVVPAGVKKGIPFIIDDYTDYVIVSVSGKNVYLDISGPSASLEKIMWKDNGKVVKLSNTKPGKYVATVMGETRTSVIVVGRTDFFFNQGFSELKPKSLGDTSLQPIADANVHLSISVTDDHDSVRIVAAQILQMDEKIIKDLPLKEISKKFYVTEQFVAPSQRFKVAVYGVVKATGKPIKRFAKIPFTPQEPPIKLPDKIKPTVEIVEGKAIEVEYNSPVKLTCKVTAYPEPTITWVNNHGVTMASKSSLVENPNKYISYMEISSATNGDKYKCYATNDEGRDSTTINVAVKEPFIIKSVPAGSTKLNYGSEGNITCDITSRLPIDIQWYFSNEMTGETRVITTSDKYLITESGTHLKIRKMDVDLVGKYACKVFLKNKKDVNKAFGTRVKIDGLVAPKVQGVTDIKVIKGKTAVFECKVVKGVPVPKITWLFGGKSGSKFTLIAGSESVLRITNVQNIHEGKYKCVAENSVGKDEHITTLFIHDLPEISSSRSMIYQGTEGDTLLKIPCVAAGVPKPVIIWKLNGRTINPNAKYSIEDGTLIIRDPMVSDTNSYTCEAKNEVGSVSATFRTYIHQAPQVSGVAAKKVKMGTPASIECIVVKGEPKPTITWQFMDNTGSKFLPIAGSDKVLHISRVENKHAGRYKCVAKNDVGSNEHVTTLMVQDLPKIPSRASTIYQSTEGDAFLKIPCAATGLPKPSISWKINGHVINPNAKYSMEDGTLIIRDPKVSDTNSYTCEAKNEVGTVSSTFRINIHQVPQVSGVAAKTVRIGSPAIIECMIVKGAPKPTITWQYMDNTGTKFSPIVGSDNVLHISRVENKHAGRYKCVAKNDVGTNEHVTKLIVQDLPKIVSSVSTIYQSTEGAPLLKIPCDATGLPKPSISWKINGLVINPNAKYSIEDGTLIIRDPKVSDTNSYTCEAKNEVGSVSATFRTYIHQAPQVSGVAAKKVRIGSPAIIECMVINGVPKPTITWQFMDNTGSKFLPIAGSEKVLHISRVENKHAGRYKCVAKNDVGTNEHVTTLIVQDLPKIPPSVSTIYQSTEGDALLKIPCDATGPPKPSITWKINGHVINPNAKYSIEDGTLIIRDPKVSDTNSYTCEAKNEVGTVSSTFRIYIHQAPQVSGVAAKKVRIGSPAIIECKVVKGEPKPTITWQFMDNTDSKFSPIAGSDKELHISRVENKHAGRYKCVAKNDVGSNEHVTTLIVQDLPKIRSSVSTVYQSTEGAALLKIPCEATGLPKPSISWKMNGHVINPNAKYSMEDGTLIIKEPKVSDTNSYTCEAKNEVGSVSATFRTYIHQAPQVSGVAAKKVKMGTPASIECMVVKGEPKPTITWQFMDNTSSKFSSIAGSDKVLYISRVENKHAGRYKCVAKNDVGSNEHVTTLLVQDLPKIRSSVSTIYQSTEGAALLKIPCDAVGPPKPNITWKINGYVINTNAKYSIEDGTLIIRDPKVSDTNSYTCEAKNEVGSVSATFRTYIHQVPQVSGVAAKKARIGSPAIIECMIVKGEPKPTITWQFMDNTGSKYSPITGSDKFLHISRVENKHAGHYKCVAKNDVGSNEHVTTLMVQDLPKIDSSASKIYQSTEGDALLKIPCEATGPPKPSITWKMNGHVINPSAKYSMEDGTLIIRDLKVSDTNSYTCEAKNEVGSVTATFRTYIRQAPQVSGVAAKKARIGMPAIIECMIVKGEPKPTITWQFMDNIGLSYSPITGSDKVLHISRVENKHAGRYKCVAKNDVGSNEHVTTLLVQDLPKIRSSVSTIYESTEGAALLKIPCDAVGPPKPSITWKINGYVINTNAKYSIEDGTLIIRDPKVSDTNSYTCEAKNEVGTVSATFRTYIHQVPQVSGVAAKKARIGSPAIIECMIVKGEPKPTITWQFMDNSGSKYSPITGSDKFLHISRVENKHAGHYKCVAKNDVGSNEHVTTLMVQDLPKIDLSASKIYQSTEGDALLKIPCEATGPPKPSITWKMNGHVINPSAKYSMEDGTLIIRDLKVSDTNSYTCEAKNEVGSVTATFRTYIRQAPQVSGVAAKKARIGMPAIIECMIVKGEPKPTITWQFMDNTGSKYSPITGSDKVLHISRVENKHAGRYKCVAKNDVGTNEHVTTLIVQDLPKIRSSVSTIYQSTEGDALLKIPCDATGLPKPSISWKMNGHVINPNAKYSIEDGTLIIKHPKVSDTNSYTCEAKNEVGTVSATFRTYIRQHPMVSGYAMMNARMGMPTSVQCNIVKGEPKPNITWQFMGESASKFVPIVGSENVLRITSAEIKHAGRYKCVAQNDVGSSEHITTLNVHFAPRIITNSSTVKGIEKDLALRIPCDVVGIPKPVITWKNKGATITPGAKYSIEDGALVIRSPKEEDNSPYTCEAKNYISSVSATIQVIVEKYPSDLGKEHNIYLKEGESKKLECEAYKSKSQSIQWFSDAVNGSMPGTNVQIADASTFDDGNYTCHVSDEHGHTETHTYVVDVGFAPKLEEPISVSDWQGEVGDIVDNCESTAKPTADVEWRFNGKVISERDIAKLGILYKWGHYSCNVSNVHGYVQRNFDVKSSVCLLPRNLNDAQFMPLLLTEDGSWPKWQTSTDYIILDEEEKITLSCPSQKEMPNNFKNFPKINALKASCNKEDLFTVEGKFYKLSDLQCSNSIQVSVIKKKVKCSTETSELIRVGYYVSGFLETYEVCFDHANNLPVYTRALMMSDLDDSLSAGYNWYRYPGIGDEKIEREFTCKNELSSCCYSKSQLVNALDLNDGPAKNSTFIDPLNVVPVWLPCDTSKTTWKSITGMVRSQLPTYGDIVAWSGTHMLQKINGTIIPRYLWKVVRFSNDHVKAIVYVNDPNPTEKDIKCTNICTKDDDWFKASDKYTYCCSLSEFLTKFDIHGTDIGETMDAALNKIKKIA